ncbi:hypothetical protein D3C85_1415180 [compost metagenome]
MVTLTLMITLLSGVICGVTSSDSEASRNATEVAPLWLVSWYGTSVPLRILAVSLSAVTTLGCEMISPLPLFSMALSSRSSSTSPRSRPRPILPPTRSTPRSTNRSLPGSGSST